MFFINMLQISIVLTEGNYKIRVVADQLFRDLSVGLTQIEHVVMFVTPSSKVGSNAILALSGDIIEDKDTVGFRVVRRDNTVVIGVDVQRGAGVPALAHGMYIFIDRLVSSLRVKVDVFKFETIGRGEECEGR